MMEERRICSKPCIYWGCVISGAISGALLGSMCVLFIGLLMCGLHYN